MNFKIEPRKTDWWYWAITLCLISAALLGWELGYISVMVISGIQIVHFRIGQGSFLAFDTQVRIIYFALTLIGLYEPARFPFYLVLWLGTAMVVFLGRCGIALALKYMPWNKKPLIKLKL